jgi:hypothetical protein
VSVVAILAVSLPFNGMQFPLFFACRVRALFRFKEQREIKQRMNKKGKEVPVPVCKRSVWY